MKVDEYIKQKLSGDNAPLFAVHGTSKKGICEKIPHTGLLWKKTSAEKISNEGKFNGNTASQYAKGSFTNVALLEIPNVIVQELENSGLDMVYYLSYLSVPVVVAINPEQEHDFEIKKYINNEEKEELSKKSIYERKNLIFLPNEMDEKGRRNFITDAIPNCFVRGTYSAENDELIENPDFFENLPEEKQKEIIEKYKAIFAKILKEINKTEAGN